MIVVNEGWRLFFGRNTLFYDVLAKFPIQLRLHLLFCVLVTFINKGSGKEKGNEKLTDVEKLAYNKNLISVNDVVRSDL